MGGATLVTRHTVSGIGRDGHPGMRALAAGERLDPRPVLDANPGSGAAGAGELARHASENANRVLNEARGPSESKPQPGDRMPDGAGPSTAGSSWVGRVAHNFKGEVWQNPENLNTPRSRRRMRTRCAS